MTDSAMARNDETICRAQHHQGYVCTRADRHRGDHIAHDASAVIVKKWRGGRARWSARNIPIPEMA